MNGKMIAKWTHTREPRPCSTCSHVRKVKVTREHYTDGSHADSWADYCAVCEDARRSLHYQRLSDMYAKRARQKFAAREKKKQQSTATPSTRG